MNAENWLKFGLIMAPATPTNRIAHHDAMPSHVESKQKYASIVSGAEFERTATGIRIWSLTGNANDELQTQNFLIKVLLYSVCMRKYCN